jgi:hypothetical protein
MTYASYKIVMKALRKKHAEVKASPAAAKKWIEESGLADIFANAPLIEKGKKPGRKKTGKKVSA